MLKQGSWGEDFRSAFYVGLDPATGETGEVSVFEAFNNGHHHRCYRNKATERFLLTSYRGFEFIDWQTGETSRNHWVRATCRLGGFPCNGLLYANPHPCECYIDSKLNGMLALSAARQDFAISSGTEETTRGRRMEGLPACDERSARDGGWPDVPPRHPKKRQGPSDTSILPATNSGRRTSGGPLTGCTAGDGLLFATSPQTREVVALHAGNGQTAWQVTVGGGVDTPPRSIAADWVPWPL